MKREKIIEILKRVFACSTALDSDFEDWANEIESHTQQDEPSAKEIHIPSDIYIQKHIELNTRHCDGMPAMDEQVFYEGAKWMRRIFEKQIQNKFNPPKTEK